jgi:hypothetical protein
MNATNDNTAAKGLRGWWLTPPRSGMQRWIAPWEYRHLRGWAAMRIASGIVFAGLGVYVILAAWPSTWAIFGAYLLVAGVANLPFAYWELNIASSVSARP